MSANAANVNEQTNIPTAQLSSYDPVEVSLADAPHDTAQEQLEGYKRAMAAIELAKRVTGDIDPAVYEQAALGIRSQAEAQAQAAGTTLAKTLAEQGIPREQYERMTSIQAADMVNQGLALDAWARHYHIEPSEDDVMELVESMAPGHAKELFEQLGQDQAQLEALSIAVLRYAANKHLASTAVVAAQGATR